MNQFYKALNCVSFNVKKESVCERERSSAQGRNGPEKKMLNRRLTELGFPDIKRVPVL